MGQSKLVMQKENIDSNRPAEPKEPLGNIEYESALDIVSAYKALKQAVTKSTTVHGPG